MELLKVCQEFANELGAGRIVSPISGLPGAEHDFFFDPIIAVMGTVKDIKGGKEFRDGCERAKKIRKNAGAKHLVREKSGGPVVKNPFGYDI